MSEFDMKSQTITIYLCELPDEKTLEQVHHHNCQNKSQPYSDDKLMIFPQSTFWNSE